MNKIQLTMAIKALLMDFSYDVDSDHGNKQIVDGIEEYTEKLLILIKEYKENAYL